MAKDHWVPACGGTEEVFTVRGRRWQYCWNPAIDQHRYLDVDADRIVEDPQFHPAFAPEREFSSVEVLAPPMRQFQEEVYFF